MRVDRSRMEARERETLDAAIHTLNAFQGSSIHARVDPRPWVSRTVALSGISGRSKGRKTEEEDGDRRKRERERETYSVIFEFTRRKQLRW